MIPPVQARRFLIAAAVALAALGGPPACNTEPTPQPAAKQAPPEIVTPADFDVKACRTTTLALKKRYGPTYADADRHLEILADIERLLKEGAKLTPTEPAKSAGLLDEAIKKVRGFNARFPPWLHGNLELVPERVITCARADEINRAVAEARPGDHIIIKPGWYKGASIRRDRAPPFPLEDPVVIRAEVPGTVHLWNSSVYVGGGAGGMVIRGLVLHRMGFGCGKGARHVRFTQMAALGGAFELAGVGCRADHCFSGGRDEAPTQQAEGHSLAPSRLDHNWLGFPHPDPPARWDATVGPSYLPVSLRVNRYLTCEYTFGPNLATGRTSPVAESGFGFSTLPVTMHAAGGKEANLHSKAGKGAGDAGDVAFDNSAASGMGGAGGVARGGRLLRGKESRFHSFTILGWLRTVAGQVLGNGAVLFSHRDGNSGFELYARTNGTLALWFGDGQQGREVASPQIYTESGRWVFFAVRFKMARDAAAKDPVEVGPGHVAFYKGAAKTAVREVHKVEAKDWPAVSGAGLDGFSIGARSDGSKAFDGYLDNIRLYHAADGAPPTNWPGGVVEREDLEKIRQSDLGK